jgi:hypothetical protein
MRYLLKPNLSRAVPILLLIAMGNIADAAEYLSPKFIPKEHPVRKVVLLPAQVRLTKSGIKGKEGMAKESDVFAEHLTSLIGKQLEARGVQVALIPFAEQAIDKNEELRATLTRLQNKYDTLAVQLHAKPKDVSKGRYSLGDEVATLRPGADADAIVFVRGTGTVQAGKKPPAWASGAALSFGKGSDVIRTFVSIVSSNSGDVLAIVDFTSHVNFQTDAADRAIAKTLDNSLKKVPFSTN